MKHHLSLVLFVVVTVTMLGVDESWWLTASNRILQIKLYFKPTPRPLWLEGRVTEIIDGDTIRLRVDDRTLKVRLTEIDAPESDQPHGKVATMALSKKIRRKTVRMATTGTDRFDRVLGRLYLDERDIHRELVAEGLVWVYRDYLTDSSLLTVEKEARRKAKGVWRTPAIPPWEWRRGSRAPVPAPYQNSLGRIVWPIIRLFSAN